MSKAAQADYTAENQTEYWNGIEAVHGIEYEDRYDAMLEPYTRHLLCAVRSWR